MKILLLSFSSKASFSFCALLRSNVWSVSHPPFDRGRRYEQLWVYIYTIEIPWLPGCPTVEEPTCQCRRLQRHRFHPWVRKIPGSCRVPMDRGPGGSQSTGVQRVGHHQSDLAHIQLRFLEGAKSLSCGLCTKSQLKLPTESFGRDLQYSKSQARKAWLLWWPEQRCRMISGPMY